MKLRSIGHRLALAVAAAVPAWAGAQSAAAPAPADPLNPRAAVPAATTPSAFAGYRPAADSGLRDWKAANDQVAKIGGWRAYAREAAAPASAAASAVPADAAGTHEHHKR